jgi:hypothetical protein
MEAVTEPTASVMAVAAHRGCVFAACCPHKLDAVCDEQPPPLKELTASHAIACHLDLVPNAAVLPNLGEESDHEHADLSSYP